VPSTLRTAASWKLVDITGPFALRPVSGAVRATDAKEVKVRDNIVMVDHAQILYEQDLEGFESVDIVRPFCHTLGASA